MNIYWTLQSNPGERIALTPSFLSPAERDRLEGMRFAKRRAEWLNGRRSAKLLLQRSSTTYSRLALDQISILNNPQGAPYYEVEGAGVPGSLSISHSGEFALCALAFGEGISLGVDLEKVERRSDVFISDYFSPAEAEWAFSLHSIERDRWANLAWSAREAVLKALGIGLRVDTRALEVLTREKFSHTPGWKPLEICSPLMVDFSAQTGGEWQVWWDQQEGYILTLAVCGSHAVELIRIG